MTSRATRAAHARSGATGSPHGLLPLSQTMLENS